MKKKSTTLDRHKQKFMGCNVKMLKKRQKIPKWYSNSKSQKQTDIAKHKKENEKTNNSTHKHKMASCKMAVIYLGLHGGVLFKPYLEFDLIANPFFLFVYKSVWFLSCSCAASQ